MILEESLKGLKVAVRGGGKLITHRPVFSPDGSSLYIIQSHKVLIYATTTGLLLSTYSTPDGTQIANIHAPEGSPNTLIIFTAAGTLLHVNIKKKKVSKAKQIIIPKSWIPISTFINFWYPAAPSSAYPHFLVLGYPQDASLPVLYSISTSEEEKHGSPTISKLCWAVLPMHHSVAMSQDGRFVVAIQENSLYCKDISDPDHCKWHSSGTRKFTCVAVHPREEFICATGDDSGRILIWANVMTSQSPAKTVFHWHTLPVVDLTFTPEGSQMISGGGECTMLKWDVNDTTNKRTLPRMGLPIRHLTCSPTGELIAVSHADNCIQLVDPYNKIVGIVKNFTQSYVPEEDEVTSLAKSNIFPAGINIDPKNSCLVLNGRPGWLQCYDLRQDKYIYSLDVAQQNYVTAERERSVPNTEVWNVAFSNSGQWMATTEGRMQKKIEGNQKEDNCEEVCTDLKLKFWKNDETKRSFVLNSCVDWPHEFPLKSLRFRPIPEVNEGFVAVSSGGGNDSRMKIWTLAENTSVHGISEFWFLEHVRKYKDLPAGPAAFSVDGSIIGAGYGRVVTLWDMSKEECEFKLSLCHARLMETINILEFGQSINSHLIVCSTDSYLIVWDLITASLLWVAPLRVQSLCVDPFSNLVAAATVDFHMYFFTPDKPRPLAIHKSVSKSAILSCAFISNRKEMDVVGLKSTLVFLNESQELCALLPSKTNADTNNQSAKVIRIGENAKLTPFAEMVAEKTVVESRKKDKKRQGALSSSGQKAYPILREIMDQSPHTMPSITYYCSQLMKSLSTPSSESDRLVQIEELVRKKRIKQKDFDDDDDDDMEVDNVNEMSVRQKYTDSEMNALSQSAGSCTSGGSGTSANFEVDSCSKLLENVDLDKVLDDDITWIESIFRN